MLTRKLFLLLLLAGSMGAHATQKIQIGVAANFTAMSDNMWNPYANYFRNGVNLALLEMAEELKKNGIEVELVEFDYGNDKVAARKVALEAVKTPVIAVVGYPYSSEVFLTADVFNDNKLLLLSPSTSADRIPLLGRYIRTCSFTDTFQGKLLSKAASDQKIKTAAIVSVADCANCQSLRKAFRASFESSGGSIIFDDTILETDVHAPRSIVKITKALKGRQLDAVFLPNYERISSSLISELYDNGIRPKVWLGGDGWGMMSDLFLQIIGNRPIEALTIGHWHKGLGTPQSRAFVKAFSQKYGKEPNDIAAVCYDSMNLLLRALIEAKTKDKAGIVDAVEKIERFNGVTGPFNYKNGDRAPAKDAVLIRLKNRKVTLLKKISQ